MGNNEENAQCGVCKTTQADDEGGELWISCTECKAWFHTECVGLEVLPPEKDPWLCSTCDKLRLEHVSTHDEDDEEEIEQLTLMTSMVKEKEELYWCLSKSNLI